MEFEEFKEFLFLFSSDVYEELSEIVSEEGQRKVSTWIIKILENWVTFAKDLAHKEQNTLLWRIRGDPLFIGRWICGYKLDREERAALLIATKHVTLAVPHLFGPEEPMETGYFMWWHGLAKSIDDMQMASICLEILDELSRHKDVRVQYAALHGLGHLHHPDRPAVVTAFINRHPEVKDDPWTLQCRDGTVM